MTTPTNTTKPLKMNDTRKAILNSLGYIGARQYYGVASDTGIPANTVRGNLRDLRKAGYVANTGDGWIRTAASSLV